MLNNFADISFNMKDAAFAAGDVLIKGFGNAMELSRNGGKSTLGTAFEAKSRDVIVSSLLGSWFSQRKDDVAIISKEHTQKIAKRTARGYAVEDLCKEASTFAGPCFSIGSLCGSAAYARGIGDFCVSIAYIENRQIMAAVVYNPINVELFHAVADMGAYLNGKSIAVSGTKKISDAYISIGHETIRTADKEVLRALFRQAMSVRTAATCALEFCYVACTRLDAAIKLNQAAYDYKAGGLIAKEAGAKLLSPDGNELSKELCERESIIAVCPGIEREIIGITSLF